MTSRGGGLLLGRSDHRAGASDAERLAQDLRALGVREAVLDACESGRRDDRIEFHLESKMRVLDEAYAHWKFSARGQRDTVDGPLTGVAHLTLMLELFCVSNVNACQAHRVNRSA